MSWSPLGRQAPAMGWAKPCSSPVPLLGLVTTAVGEGVGATGETTRPLPPGASLPPQAAATAAIARNAIIAALGRRASSRVPGGLPAGRRDDSRIRSPLLRGKSAGAWAGDALHYGRGWQGRPYRPR